MRLRRGFGEQVKGERVVKRELTVFIMPPHSLQGYYGTIGSTEGATDSDRSGRPMAGRAITWPRPHCRHYESTWRVAQSQSRLHDSTQAVTMVLDLLVYAHACHSLRAPCR